MPAGAAAANFLDFCAGVGAEVGVAVGDVEVGVVDGDGEDFAAVGGADLEFAAGDVEGALAGDDAGDLQGGFGSWGWSGQACAMQAAAGAWGQWAGKGASELVVGDDVDQVGVDSQDDAVAGQGHADAELGAAQGDASGPVDGAVDLDDCVGGQGAGG